MAFLRKKMVKLLCQYILSFLLVTSSLLLVIQLFIMESKESRKLKESSTVPEPGYSGCLSTVRSYR